MYIWDGFNKKIYVIRKFWFIISSPTCVRGLKVKHLCGTRCANGIKPKNTKKIRIRTTHIHKTHLHLNKLRYVRENRLYDPNYLRKPHVLHVVRDTYTHVGRVGKKYSTAALFCMKNGVDENKMKNAWIFQHFCWFGSFCLRGPLSLCIHLQLNNACRFDKRNSVINRTFKYFDMEIFRLISWIWIFHFDKINARLCIFMRRVGKFNEKRFFI